MDTGPALYCRQFPGIFPCSVIILRHNKNCATMWAKMERKPHADRRECVPVKMDISVLAILFAPLLLVVSDHD